VRAFSKKEMKANSPERESELLRLAEQLDHDLRSIRRALRKPLEVETAKGELTLPQTAVMREVVRTEGINLRDLSRAVSLAHSTVSGIVDRLEKRGMIERRPDQKDGRVSCIFPSSPVREFIRNRIPELNRTPLLDALARANKSERLAIAAALRRLRELLEPE
jgi:DNA-binding MarR family transcriptional regulator